MNDSPVNTATNQADKSGKRSRVTIVAVLICLAVVGERIVSAFHEERESSRQAQAHGRLAWIYFNIARYVSIHGQPIPRVLVDADGKALHSWRMLLDQVYESPLDVNLSEPWDSKHNLEVIRAAGPQRWLRSPFDSSDEANTSFVAIEPPPNVRWMVDEQYARSIPWIVVEMPNSGIFWAEPRDPTPAVYAAWLEKKLEDDKPIHFVCPDGRVGYFKRLVVVFYSRPEVLFDPSLGEGPDV